MKRTLLMDADGPTTTMTDNGRRVIAYVRQLGEPKMGSNPPDQTTKQYLEVYKNNWYSTIILLRDFQIFQQIAPVQN
jgi:hypothetical protein